MDMNETTELQGLRTHLLELDNLKSQMGEMRRQLGIASCLTARIIDDMSEAIMITDANKIIRTINPAFETTTGYTANEAIGRTPALLKSGHHGNAFYREMWEALNSGGRWQGEIWNRHKSGDIYPEWLSINAVKDERQLVTHYVGIFSDAHTQEAILERLRYLAYYDGLTGLPNQRLFLDRLNMSISHARRDKQLLAVMFIDIDHFKQINDTLGHKMGDRVLVGMTQRMKNCLREEDTLARLAGDEFTVILPSLSHPEAANHVAQKFLDVCAQPLHIDDHALQVSASIGIGIFPNDGEDADSLLHKADMAMYRIKNSGRNGFTHFDLMPSSRLYTLSPQT